MSAKKRSLVHFLGLFMALTAMALVGACGGDDEEPAATAVLRQQPYPLRQQSYPLRQQSYPLRQQSRRQLRPKKRR